VNHLLVTSNSFLLTVTVSMSAHLLIYNSMFTYIVFNMAAPSGKFLRQTSAILSRLKHVCTAFHRHTGV